MTTKREQGPRCPNCLKPVEVGQVVLPWDDHDPGEMHADCERPYRTDHVQQPECPAPCVLIGDPMRQVPLAALASARAPIAGDAVEALRHALDRDRYVVAACVGAIRKALDGRRWLREAGRGRYAYDDDRYQREFGLAFDEIVEAMRPLSAVAIDKTNCTTDPDKVKAARDAGADAFAALAHPRPALDREAVGEREWSGVVANDPCQSADETDEDGNPCWYIEIQSIGGHSIIATIWGASPEQVQTRADAILALATPPARLSGESTNEGERECPSSPDGQHQVDTSMESGPNNCFHCEAPMSSTNGGVA